jgi:copper chaperone CopZ
MQLTYSCPDIHCDGCAASIKSAAANLPGLRSLAVDVAAKTVSVDVESVQAAEALKNLLEDIGFPVAA